jgi:hypothetical protein
MEFIVEADLDEAFEIMKATNNETPKDEDKRALQRLFDEFPELWQVVTDLTKTVENNILKSEVFKSFLTQEAYRRKLSAMRDNLGWQNSSELEKILIEQICLNWLRLNLMENLHHTKTTESHTVETGIYWDKRLIAAQKRYLRACESLAKVRKLLAEAALKGQEAENKRIKGAAIVRNVIKEADKAEK